MRLNRPRDLGGSDKLPRHDPVDRRIALACAFAQKEASRWSLAAAKTGTRRIRLGLPVSRTSGTQAAVACRPPDVPFGMAETQSRTLTLGARRGA